MSQSTIEPRRGWITDKTSPRMEEQWKQFCKEQGWPYPLPKESK